VAALLAEAAGRLAWKVLEPTFSVQAFKPGDKEEDEDEDDDDGDY